MVYIRLPGSPFTFKPINHSILHMLRVIALQSINHVCIYAWECPFLVYVQIAYTHTPYYICTLEYGIKQEQEALARMWAIQDRCNVINQSTCTVTATPLSCRHGEHFIHDSVTVHVSIQSIIVKLVIKISSVSILHYMT